jgi:hypothetical protein
VLGIERDADARVQFECEPGGHKRLLQRTQDPFGHRDDLALLPEARHEDGELVTAQTPYGLALTKHASQPARQLLENTIAVVVPERVVDLLEAVQVHQHERGSVAAPPRADDGSVDQVLELLPVRQPSEWIATSLLFRAREISARLPGRARSDGPETHHEQEQDSADHEIEAGGLSVNPRCNGLVRQ